ncbi:MAG: hypothetical protein KAU23_00870 [Anaerolineales bacterium]|nr:hypothetical protein [Anaerolineales bacterium]
MKSGIEEDPPEENNEKISTMRAWAVLMRPARLFGCWLPGLLNSIIFTRMNVKTKGIFYGD